MCKIGLTIFVGLFFVRIFAQNTPIIPDRPGIADSPFSVAQRSFQGEIGLDYLNRQNTRHIQVPNTLLRAGITKNAELRLYAKHAFSSDTLTEDFNSALHPIGLGTKITLWKQQKWRPHIGIMTHLYFPTKYSKRAPYMSEMGADIFLLFQHNIGERFSINYNLGGFKAFNASLPLWMSSWCFNYMITPKLGSFVEYYNLKNNTFTEHAFDGGFTFLWKPTCQFDLSAGLSQLFWADKQEPRTMNYFFSGGVSFKIQ